MYNYIPIFSLEEDYQEEENNVCLAYWCMSHKELKFNLKAFKWCYDSKASYPLYRKIINTISHEVIHGVVQKIMELDKWSGSFDPEFPMLNGMDDDYKRVSKKLE
jgi:hypothetical protein